MLIHHDPEDWVTEITKDTCEHHKRMPWDISWAGCTCSVAYSQRRATPEERTANKRERMDEEARRKKHIADYDAGKKP